MKLINKPLQVWHYPQVPCEPFKVEVKNEYEALKIGNVLADQHLFLLNNKFIADYANDIDVMMNDGGEWVSYFNEAEGMDWDEFAEFIETELSMK